MYGITIITYASVYNVNHVEFPTNHMLSSDININIKMTHAVYKLTNLVSIGTE